MRPIRYRPSARSDFEAIHRYIADDNPHAASRVIAHIRQSIDRLAVFPKSGRMGETQDTYELVVSRYPYVVVYQITDAVEIVAVFHTARLRE